MGNSHPKFEYSLLTEAEKPIIIDSFKCMSKDSKKIKKEKLRKFWEMQIDPSLLPFIVNFLFSKKRKVAFQKFAALYVYGSRGTVEERLLMLKMSMNPVKKKKNEVIEVNRTFAREVCACLWARKCHKLLNQNFSVYQRRG